MRTLRNIIYALSVAVVAYSASNAYVATTNAEVATRALGGATVAQNATIRDFRNVPQPQAKPVAVWWEMAEAGQ